MNRVAGLRLYGIIRARGLKWRAARALGELEHVRYRDLAALVEAVPAVPDHVPGSTPDEARADASDEQVDDVPLALETDSPVAEAVRGHQRLVERVMRRRTILPVPYGVVFRRRDALERFLRDQYLALDEGLAFIDGHWEMRVHVSTPDAPDTAAAFGDDAMHLYSELRRSVRAAIPFPREDRRFLTAAFLVDRSDWIDFVERADSLGEATRDLSVDVTGPWPPYDFVRLVD